MDLHIKIPPIPSKKGVKEAGGSDLWQNHTELVLTLFLVDIVDILYSFEDIDNRKVQLS